MGLKLYYLIHLGSNMMLFSIFCDLYAYSKPHIFSDSVSLSLFLNLSISLPPLQALEVALAEHQGDVDYLMSAVEQVFQKAPPDISQK